MSKKIKYVPPAAEMILLVPCEALAMEEWAFGDTWKTKWGNWGKFKDSTGASAGIAFGGTFTGQGPGEFFTPDSGTE